MRDDIDERATGFDTVLLRCRNGLDAVRSYFELQERTSGENEMRHSSESNKIDFMADVRVNDDYVELERSLLVGKLVTS